MRPYRYNDGASLAGTFTFEDFLAFLESKNSPPRILYLLRKYPDVVEPYLDRIYQRLQEKGLISPTPQLTAAEAAALPYLRRLDAALKEGGDAGARAELIAIVSEPEGRQALRALAQG